MMTIAWFEFRTKMQRVSTYVYFSVFTLLAALWMAAANRLTRTAPCFCAPIMAIWNSSFAGT